jgi:hypothetical protein
MKMKALALIMMMLLPLGLSFITVTKTSAGTEIKYDDGSWENHWNIAPAYKVGELFTKNDLPYAENLLVTVELYIYNVDSSDPQTLTMFILDSNFNVMASMSTPPLVVGWNSIDVSSYGLVFADNFTIGVQWLLSDGVTRTAVRLGLDLDLPQNWNHTYEYNTDHWPIYPHWGPSYNASAAENGNWMIRAIVEPTVHSVMKYDDGSWEDQWDIAPAYKVGEMFNKSDLPYAENLLVTVEIYMTSVSNDTQQLTMFFLDGTSFNDLIAPIYTPYLKVGWNNIDVSSYGLVLTNNFLIGVQWLQPDGSRTWAWLGYDLDFPQNENHTYEYNTDHWPNDSHWGPSYNASAAENGNWMIRAVVDPVHDVAVTDVTPYGNWTYQGWSMNVNVTTTNLGGFTENETLTLNYSYGATNGIIGTMTALNLVPNETRTVTFTWNTSGVEPNYAGYTLTASADISPLVDSNLTNNVLQSPTTVVVRIPGDIDGDGAVDITDAIMFSNNFGLQKGDARWNPAADLNQDGVTNILDMIIIAGHFGEISKALKVLPAPKV